MLINFSMAATQCLLFVASYPQLRELRSNLAFTPKRLRNPCIPPILVLFMTRSVLQNLLALRQHLTQASCEFPSRIGRACIVSNLLRLPSACVLEGRDRYRCPLSEVIQPISELSMSC